MADSSTVPLDYPWSKGPAGRQGFSLRHGAIHDPVGQRERPVDGRVSGRPLECCCPRCASRRRVGGGRAE